MTIKQSKTLKTTVLTTAFLVLLGASPLSYAGKYLCGNVKKNGTMGPNARKVTVKAPNLAKAVVKAKQRFVAKGYKVRRLRCTPI